MDFFHFQQCQILFAGWVRWYRLINWLLPFSCCKQQNHFHIGLWKSSRPLEFRYHSCSTRRTYHWWSGSIMLELYWAERFDTHTLTELPKRLLTTLFHLVSSLKMRLLLCNLCAYVQWFTQSGDHDEQKVCRLMALLDVCYWKKETTESLSSTFLVVFFALNNLHQRQKHEPANHCSCNVYLHF